MIPRFKLWKVHIFLLLSTGIVFIFTMNNQNMPLSYIQQIISNTSNFIRNSKLKNFEQVDMFRLLDINQSRMDNVYKTTMKPHEMKHSCLEFKINQPNTCKQTNYSIVFIIPSTPNRILARNAIRKTWGGYASDIGIPVVFLLGGPTRRYQQEYIENENALHGDIIQMKCLDTYRNLSLKSIAMMKWVSVHCANTSYVLKVDDDMIINVDRLLNTYYQKHSSKTIFGKLMSGFSPHRLKTSKWYVSEDEYKDDFYPDFTSGPCYLFTTDSAKILYETSLKISYLHLEDVFITGIVAKKAGIKRVANDEFKNAHLDLTFTRFSTLISAHEYSPHTLYQIWNRLAQLPKNVYFSRLQNNKRRNSS